MDVLKNILLSLMDFLGFGTTPELIGVAGKDNFVCLVYKEFSGKIFYYISEDGINFDRSAKIYAVNFPNGFSYFKPSSIHDWNNSAGDFVASRQDLFDHAR